MGTLYFATLLLHSWLRWVVLGSGVAAVALALREAQTGGSTRPSTLAGRVFVGAVDANVLLGIVLYLALSPLARAVRQNFPDAIHDPVLRFFGVEHLAVMLLAAVVAHVAVARSHRAPSSAVGRRRLAWGVGLALLLIAVAIPWPGLAYGRDLFRSY